MLRYLLIFLAISSHLVGGDDEETERSIVTLVGFFHPDNSDDEMAFRFAVERINIDYSDELIMFPLVEHMATFDSYNISQRVCELAKNGIGGIIGPPSMEASSIIESISNRLHIPFIKTYWDTSDSQYEGEGPQHSVNVYPDAAILSKALAAAVKGMHWKKFAIIYEEDNALFRLHDVFKIHKRAYTQEGHLPFTTWRLDDGGDYRPMLKKIRDFKESRLLLDCKLENVIYILQQAKEMGMIGEYHSFVLTSLDVGTADFGEFKEGLTNITALRIIDPQRHMVQAAVEDMKISQRILRKKTTKLRPETIKTDTALMYDAVYLFAESIRKSGRNVTTRPLSCTNDNIWEFGDLVVQNLKESNITALTGRIQFDQETGKRNFFEVEITELTKMGFRKIGSWNPESKINISRSKSEMESEIYQSISNKTFIVVSKKEMPYLDIDENGNYYGYAYDVIDELAKILKFKFKFILSDKQGTFDEDKKEWDGMIKVLQDRKADLGICDLTITYDRRTAVDFTPYIMTLGISILHMKPEQQDPNLFSFLEPFSVEVWIIMATAYTSVSVLLYLLARITPYEWKNPHPCNKEPEEVENTLVLYNAIWHNIGSLMQQGSDVDPAAFSTRIVAGMWWFVVLIMISSYTANLAAFLTKTKMGEEIDSIEALAKQTKVKYGVLKSGSTANFIKDSNDSLYQKMWSAMESAKPSVFVNSTKDGVLRVLKSNRKFAFFMESSSIEYFMKRDCLLRQIGGLLDSKGYGIAMPFNSPYRIAISEAVLSLTQSGKLGEIKEKWWSNPNKTCEEEKKDEGADSLKLGIANVGGLFIVLGVGCAISFLVSVFEFLWNVNEVAVQEKMSLSEAFRVEFKFLVSCSGTTKPVRRASADLTEVKKITEKPVEDSGGKQERRRLSSHRSKDQEYISRNEIDLYLRSKSHA